MSNLYEAEVAVGIEAIARAEIASVIGKRGRIIAQHRAHEILFTYEGDVHDLQQLTTVIAVYAVTQFDIPRPKALLGHENFQQLLADIRAGMDAHAQHETLYLSAAGSGSSVMMRVKYALADALGLTVSEDEGDLWLRLRRTAHQKRGWDVLVRITARPLATRDWRVCNMQGALNASVARAMITMTNPRPTDRFLNIACGSGTIMIERALHMPARAIIGCEIADEALSCARANITTSACQGLHLIQADAITLPIDAQSIDALCADLPFGQLVGTHEENEWLYPAILHEAARVARVGARFAVITHEVRLMERVLHEQTQWHTQYVQVVTLTGLHPRILVMERV